MYSIPLQTVITSHLNDISMEMSIGTDETIETAQKRLAFVKYLVFTYRDRAIEDVRVSDELLNEMWLKATRSFIKI